MRGISGYVCALLLLACGGGGEETEPLDFPPVGEPVTATIGAAGGTVTSPDGHLLLDIPAGALAGDVAISIQQLEVDGGLGWSLAPEGTTFAVPVLARLTFTRAELGEPSTAMAGDERISTVPMLAAYHMSGAADEAPELPVASLWHQDAIDLEYAAELAHFSDLVVTKAGDITLVHAGRVSMGETTTIRAFRALDDFARHGLFLYCQDVDPRYQYKETSVRLRFSNLQRHMTASFAPSGVARPLEDSLGMQGYEGDVRCTRTGRGAQVEATFTYEREGGLAWPAGCTPRVLETEYAFAPITCIGDCTAGDPVDVSMLADGDPALDLVCVQTGVMPERQFFKPGTAWVHVIHEGPWLPSADYYSWYSKVTLQGPAGPLGSATRQHHDGVDETLYDGMLAGAAYLHVTSDGYVLFASPALGQITSATVESGLMKTPSSPFVMDSVPVPTFDSTVRAP